MECTIGIVDSVPLPLPISDSGNEDRRLGLPPPPASASARQAPTPVSSVRPGSVPGEEACYRHPNRLGPRRCTRCGKPACPDCLEQAAVGSHCVDCRKAARPDLKTRARFWQASKPAIVAYTLIGINIAVFVGLGLWFGMSDMLVGGVSKAHEKFALNATFLDGESKTIRFTDGTSLSTSGNEWYRIVTSGFLHYGIIHLALNMYFLYVLGNQMEPTVGRGKFLALYTASLLGGSAGVLVLDSGGFTAGASGAVFGLLGAVAVGIWQHGVNPFSTQIGRLLLINLGLTFFVGGISIGGHLGGLVAGALCGFVMMAPGYKAYPSWMRWATPAAVGFAAIAVSVIVAR
jgi:membrane associated rhomboid family serine protease